MKAMALFALTVWPMAAQPQTGLLHVAILDKVSGKAVPAMVCITSKADGSWRVPPDGTIRSPHPVTGNEQIAGWAAGPGTKQWMPTDPGPIRIVMNAPTPAIDESMRQNSSRAYANLPAMPYWNEPVAYFVPGPFDITLPPGQWRLVVSRGVEYLPVFEEFALEPAQKLRREIKLERWVDMPRAGWYSGDPEFHNWRDQPWRNDFILTWAQAADIHMTSVLSYNNSPTTTGHPQMGYGKHFRYQKGNFALASGHEGPRTSPTEQGHLMQLNTTSIVRDTARDHLMDVVCDKIHERGGLCGYAHLAWSVGVMRKTNPGLHPGWDVDINAIRGKIDFIEILQFRQLGVDNYYDFLNMGVKLTALAASDVTGGDTMGESRTYSYTGREFSPDRWYEGVKHGHTFVTNGPMISLTVDKAIAGDEVRVAKDAKLRIHARGWAPEAIGAPKLLEVISHGKVIRTVESHDPHQNGLAADFELPAAESQWIVARVRSYNDAVAHTSPVYVIVDGVSFADRARLPQLAQQRLDVLDFAEKRLRDPEYCKRNGYSAVELPHLFEIIQEARARYTALAARK